MDIHSLTRNLAIKNDSKIVMVVADGLGGLPFFPAERPNWRRHELQILIDLQQRVYRVLVSQ